MNLGLIIKGILGIKLGPVFTVLSSIINYITGEQSAKSILFSLGLSGFLDYEFDLDDFGYEIDSSYSGYTACTSLAIGKAILETGVETFLSNYNISRRPSGLYVANIAILDANGQNLKLNSIWKSKSYNISSGVHKEKYLGKLEAISSDKIILDSFNNDNLSYDNLFL